MSVGNGLADGRRDVGESCSHAVSSHGVAACEGGVFGGAVAVDEANMGEGKQDFADMVGREDIAPCEELANGPESLNLLLNHQME